MGCGCYPEVILAHLPTGDDTVSIYRGVRLVDLRLIYRNPLEEGEVKEDMFDFGLPPLKLVSKGAQFPFCDD